MITIQNRIQIMFVREVIKEDVEKFCDEFRTGVSISASGQKCLAKVPYINNSNQVIEENNWSDLLKTLKNASNLTQEQEKEWLVNQGLL